MTVTPSNYTRCMPLVLFSLQKALSSAKCTRPPILLGASAAQLSVALSQNASWKHISRIVQSTLYFRTWDYGIMLESTSGLR